MKIYKIRKSSTRKLAYIELYSLKRTHWRDHNMTPAFLSQLSFCKSEEARRLLLGVSEQFTEQERAA